MSSHIGRLRKLMMVNARVAQEAENPGTYQGESREL